MGKPDSNVIYTLRYRSEPGEVKHLSTLRKRKQRVIPVVVASEPGKISLNRCHESGIGVAGPR